MTTIKGLFLFCVSILGTVRCDCGVGFMGFNGYCYAVLPVKVSWSEALRLCEAFQAKLAWIDSKTEDTFIEGMLARYHDSIASSEVWIGGSDLLVEGIWLWADTLQPLSYKNFLPGQPDNGNTNQHCLALFRDQGFKWDDFFCDQKLFPLCKAMSKHSSISGIWNRHCGWYAYILIYCDSVLYIFTPYLSILPYKITT